MGRSHECDWPLDVVELPVLTEPRFEADGASGEIDRRVRSLVERALSVYRVDGETLRRVAPDVVVTQTQCEVCAVSRPDVERALADWLGERPCLVSLEPRRLSDVWDDMRRVARVLEVPERGGAVADLLEARVADLARRAAAAGPSPTVVVIEWIEPLMAAGNWMPELVQAAGGTSVLGEAGRRSPWIEWETVAARDPDVLVVSPCGFGIPRTRAEMPSLAARPGWQDLKAVRTGRVYLADGVSYFHRSGPRLVDSIEILAELLHPTAFAGRHRDDGWEPWTPFVS